MLTCCHNLAHYLIVAFILVCFCIGFTVRTIWLSFFRVDNPYIDAHRLQAKNNLDYDAYLKWVKENLGDCMPYDKVLTDEEKRMNNDLGLK
jgi:hypothetical protein